MRGHFGRGPREVAAGSGERRGAGRRERAAVEGASAEDAVLRWLLGEEEAVRPRRAPVSGPGAARESLSEGRLEEAERRVRSVAGAAPFAPAGRRPAAPPTAESRPPRRSARGPAPASEAARQLRELANRLGSLAEQYGGAAEQYGGAEQQQPPAPIEGEVFLQTDGAGQQRAAPIGSAWVYLRQGTNLTQLRTDTDGRLMALRQGGDPQNPGDYTTPYMSRSRRQVDLYYTRDALPLPASLINNIGSGFMRRTITLPTVWQQASQPNAPVRATIALPLLSIRLTTPAQLSLWPLLWELPTDAYHTDGLSQGAALWNGTRLTVTENDPAPAPSAAVRPRERGLALSGAVGAGPTAVRIQIFDGAGNAVRLKTSPTATTAASEITATLGAEANGLRPFGATVYFDDPAAALGRVLIFVLGTGGLVPFISASVVHLVGLQAALVNDHAADPDGRQRGAVPGEADEKMIVDFIESPQRDLRRITAQARARRMVAYDITTRDRELSATNNAVVRKPEMPLWMAEFQLVGVDGGQLENLLLRRRNALPGAPGGLRVDLRWLLTLGWDGPDIGPAAPARAGLPRVYRYEDSFRNTQTVNFSLDAHGRLQSAYSTPPAAATFPVTGRRLPQVVTAGQTRTWGRRAGAAAREALVVEWQPLIASAAGREIMRGGDGTLSLESVSFDGTRVDAGLLTGAGGATTVPPPAEPDIRLPRFRVRGVNPPAAEGNRLVDAVVEEYYNAHNREARIAMLPLNVWQETLRRVCGHESRGRQFETRGAGRRQYGRVYYGHEQDMPFFGPPNGYGFGQVDDPAGLTDDVVWSYLENIRTSVRHFMDDKARVAYNRISPHMPTPVDRRTRAVYRREIVRLYNGGTEFRRDGGQWAIHPTVEPWKNPSDHSQGPNQRLQYPNNVLGTNVVYHTGTGAATTFPWPITFNEADFGPGI